MSAETENQGDNTEVAEGQVDDSTFGADADGMSKLFDEKPSPPSESSPDLEAMAVTAAETAVDAGEQALQEAEEALELLQDATASAESADPPRGGMRDKLLFATVFVNLALLTVFLVIPGLGDKSGKKGGGATTGPETSHDKKGATTGDRAEELRPKPQGRGEAFRDDQLYEKALFLSRQGDYPGAIRALKRLLRVNSDLSDAYKRLVFGALAHNLIRDGRKPEAEEYLDRIDRITKLQSLPEDLVTAARRAMVDGRGMDMRRYYARFLLQQDQIRPDMRDTITEAYLRIADSYRLDAEEGAKADREAEARKAGKVTAPKKGKEGH